MKRKNRAYTFDGKQVVMALSKDEVLRKLRRPITRDNLARIKKGG